MPEQKNDNLLKITKVEQYRTAAELMEHSRPSSIYFALLILSSTIIASGLLLDSASIVIGGMLVTPVLTPVLAIALGISVGDPQTIKNISILLGKSFLVILIASLIIAFLFGPTQIPIVFSNTVLTAVLYFLVAVASGVAATLAWTRKEISEVLPGISIAVSLVPPLSLVGIWLSSFELEFVRFYFIVFVLNLFGIVMGSLVVFSLLNFHKAKEKVHQEAVANKPPEKAGNKQKPQK